MRTRAARRLGIRPGMRVRHHFATIAGL
jgi:hypothetical protein